MRINGTREMKSNPVPAAAVWAKAGEIGITREALKWILREPSYAIIKKIKGQLYLRSSHQECFLAILDRAETFFYYHKDHSIPNTEQMKKPHTPQEFPPADAQELPSADDNSRRDFLYLATGSVGAVGLGYALWPLIDQMNPSADTQAEATLEVDLSTIAEGQSKTFTWRGKPLFIRHRTSEEIAEADSVDLNVLPDPQADTERVQNPQWLVLIGICTHLGCVPKGQSPNDYKGDYDGWFCPCHGSHYDTSGRIRQGPAPTNLEIPSYTFLDPTRIRIG